jgi:hypothetical protein
MECLFSICTFRHEVDFLQGYQLQKEKGMTDNHYQNKALFSLIPFTILEVHDTRLIMGFMHRSDSFIKAWIHTPQNT